MSLTDDPVKAFAASVLATDISLDSMDSLCRRVAGIPDGLGYMPRSGPSSGSRMLTDSDLWAAWLACWNAKDGRGATDTIDTISAQAAFQAWKRDNGY